MCCKPAHGPLPLSTVLFWLQQLTGHPIIKSSVTLTATFGPHGFPVCAVLFTATFGPHGFPVCCPLYSNFWATWFSSVLSCLQQLLGPMVFQCAVLFTATFGPHGFPECCPLYSNFWTSPLSSVLTCLQQLWPLHYPHCDVLVTAVLGPQRQRNTPLLHLYMQATQPLQQL